MIEGDPLDDMLRKFLTRAHLIASDRDSAVYERNLYRELLSQPSLNPANDLAALIAEAGLTN
jgi:hypothetical protein